MAEFPKTDEKHQLISRSAMNPQKIISNKNSTRHTTAKLKTEHEEKKF